jgi:hypothetical protein
MRGLREWQREFSRCVLQGGEALAGEIKPNGLSPAQRLAVYRNNTFLSLAEALKDGYPVVERLVGEDFFKQMASAFIARQPPQSGCLLEYGEGFPDFVAAYPPAQSLAYLPAVARLEWLWQAAFHEAEAAPLDWAALADVPAQAQGDLRFRLHPTARLLQSGYPVLRIWEANQPGFAGDEAISLAEGGCRLLVFRPEWEVEIHALEAGEHAFLAALAQAASLLQALEQALGAETGFDLEASLRRCLERGLLTHFYF